MNEKNFKINFLGDSITEGSGTSGKAALFTTLVAEKTGAVCRNYGIGGTRIARQTKPSDPPSHDLDFCSRVDEMDADADIIFVFGGTNDYGHGDAPIGEFDDRTPYTFYGALHTLYQSLINKYPTSIICSITPVHRLNEHIPQTTGTLEDYVKAIRQVAEYYSLPVLDFFASLGIQPNVPISKEKYAPDGLHPNDEGHKHMAHKIVKFIENL